MNSFSLDKGGYLDTWNCYTTLIKTYTIHTYILSAKICDKCLQSKKLHFRFNELPKMNIGFLQLQVRNSVWNLLS